MKYIPTVIFAFIEVVFTLVVLDNAHYDNKVLISGLIIIYASIRSVGISLGNSMNRMLSGLAFDLLKIKERIKRDDDTDNEMEKLMAAQELVNGANIKLIIRSIGVFIIYIIGIVSILN
jgi:hypothetical protein